MKKLFALTLAVVMIFAMTISASAANSETVTDAGSQNINVEGKYVDESTKDEKISADVVWGAMEFSYTKTGKYVWDADQHQYLDQTQNNWSATGNTVTVTNHSNVAVSVNLKFTANTGYSVTGTFDNSTFDLPSAEGKAVDATELAKVSTLTLGGELDSGNTTMATVGTISVSITKKATANP